MQLQRYESYVSTKVETFVNQKQKAQDPSGKQFQLVMVSVRTIVLVHLCESKSVEILPNTNYSYNVFILKQ